jgi:hypothetical protein
MHANDASFTYEEKAWHIPQSFEFDDGTTLWTGWRRWWLGSINAFGEDQYQIKPYRHLTDGQLPYQNLKNDLKTKWRPN